MYCQWHVYNGQANFRGCYTSTMFSIQSLPGKNPMARPLLQKQLQYPPQCALFTEKTNCPTAVACNES
jgi:hypothetical protein